MAGIVVVFEYSMDLDDTVATDEYLAMSARLRDALSDMEGYGGVERFVSTADPSRFVAIGTFTDEEAVRRWRNHAEHRLAQERGRASWFTDYRLRVGHVVRDYGPTERDDVPQD